MEFLVIGLDGPDGGARLAVADLQPARVCGAAERFGARQVPVAAIAGTDAEIFAPCALGGAFADAMLPQLRARIAAGAANNQFAAPHHAEEMHRSGILHAPDYVISAGGMIQLAGERLGFDVAERERRIAGIATTLESLFAHAREAGISTQAAADRLVEDRLAGHPPARPEGAGR